MQVGARALEVGVWGAYQNVMINMTGIEDEQFVKNVTNEAEKIKNHAEQACKNILQLLNDRKD